MNPIKAFFNLCDEVDAAERGEIPWKRKYSIFYLAMAVICVPALYLFIIFALSL